MTERLSRSILPPTSTSRTPRRPLPEGSTSEPSGRCGKPSSSVSEASDRQQMGCCRSTLGSRRSGPGTRSACASETAASRFASSGDFAPSPRRHPSRSERAAWTSRPAPRAGPSFGIQAAGRHHEVPSPGCHRQLGGRATRPRMGGDLRSVDRVLGAGSARRRRRRRRGCHIRGSGRDPAADHDRRRDRLPWEGRGRSRRGRHRSRRSRATRRAASNRSHRAPRHHTRPEAGDRRPPPMRQSLLSSAGRSSPSRAHRVGDGYRSPYSSSSQAPASRSRPFTSTTTTARCLHTRTRSSTRPRSLRTSSSPGTSPPASTSISPYGSGNPDGSSSRRLTSRPRT